MLGIGCPEADLAMVTFTDVIALANDYHGETLDFTAAVVDSNDVAAENADVTIIDLLPPFVTRAYWDGDLVIEFNEEIDVSTIDTGECFVRIAGTDDILFNQAFDVADALATSNTLAWIDAPIPDRTDIFDLGDWAEADYNDVGGAGTLAHTALITDCVPDANGNTWQWVDLEFQDILGNQQCRIPRFLAVDVLGDFTDTKTAPDFDCLASGDVLITTTTSHPVNYVSTYGCDPDVLDLDTMRLCMAQNIFFLDFDGPNLEGPVDGLNPDGMELTAMTINASRTVATYTITNTLGLVFDNGDTVVFQGLVGGLNGVYVSIYEVTPNQLPIFQLNCIPPGGP
jgi:hypothetical protein